ncbi:hypothetical protein BH10ACI4_BH10ACI4_26470 [soil metagenome]
MNNLFQQKSRLAKLATIFAVALGLAFGLCTISASAGMSANERVAGFFVWASVVIEAICLTSLLIIGIVATVEFIRHK